MIDPVVIYGADPLLLEIRASVLARNGISAACEVVHSSEDQIMRESKVAVVCSSLAFEAQEELAATLKKRYGKIKSMMIRRTEQTCRELPSGEYVCGTDPEQIVSCCKGLLREEPSGMNER